MKKFTIEVCRTSYSTKSFDVEAKTEKDAIKKAMDNAYNTLFIEKDAEYNIEKIVTHKEK